MGIFSGIATKAAGTAVGGFISANLIWFKVGALVVALLAIWAWDANRLSKRYDAGYEKAQLECVELRAQQKIKEAEAAIDKLNAWAADQAKARETAATDTAETEAALEAINRRLALFRADMVKLKPLPADCKADADRVTETNKAMGHET